MKYLSNKIFFDKYDHQLLSIVNDILAKGDKSRSLRSLFGQHMHPQGIKELAAPRGLRIAYAVASLLGSLKRGLARDRIRALRSLRDEVLLSSTIFFQKNTARVLLQIMKELLRSKGNEQQQLMLAHDFRMASTANPRLVRAELAKYHLLEMPEEWNQYAFDDHVHDANTKGRKSPTHLVMDAWIKGIRYLTVVYYNYVSPQVVEELIEASSILDIKVHVGIEMSCRFYDKYVRFSWEPHGFDDNRAFLKFLRQEPVIKMMEEGRRVSLYQQKYVFAALKNYNNRHRLTINEELGLALKSLSSGDFLRFVGSGQPSVLHLARFIHNALANHVQSRMAGFIREINGATAGRKEHLRQRLEQIKAMDIECIIEKFLAPSSNPEIHDPNHPQDNPELPELLGLSPKELICRLLSLHSSSQFTLNLSNLSAHDILEILYSCEGMISHIEAYNLKDAAQGITAGSAGGRDHFAGKAVDCKSPEQHYQLVSDLQKALNDDNVIDLKRVIRSIMRDYEEQRLLLKKQIELVGSDEQKREKLEQEYSLMLGRREGLMDIVYHLEILHNYYKKRKLGSRLGSRSTGQAEHQHGMGLVVIDTLPVGARKAACQSSDGNGSVLIPVSGLLTRNSHSRCLEASELPRRTGFFKRFSFWSKLRYQKWQDWSLDRLIVHPGMAGNIATLGGLGRSAAGKDPLAGDTVKVRAGNHGKYLNTNLKNTLKVFLGLIPAFLTFSLTKDWWVLAYFGAFIWFGITGFRNIIQSVLGGGGLRRSPLLPWNSLVSWSRIADSLLYTGFSVPILDYLVKTLLLDRAFGITTATDPVLLYAVMGLANGIYISSHNAFRGLPKNAVVGNFFRSILAIPLAILLNSFVGVMLAGVGVVDVTGALQKWAAIISKFASDCVAAIIEGLADRQINIQVRLSAYRTKISQLFAEFSRLDLVFPQEDVLDILQSPKMIMETLNYEAREQEKLVIVNALDLMYFWMYQPRARRALEIICMEMSPEEWLIFYRSQLVLKRYREISQFFVDGLVGKNFSTALSFYLARFEEYLADLAKLGAARR